MRQQVFSDETIRAILKENRQVNLVTLEQRSQEPVQTPEESLTQAQLLVQYAQDLVERERQANASKYRFIPFSEFAKFGITERNERQRLYPTDIGKYEFWSYEHTDGLTYIPLEDICKMLDQITEDVLFGFLELGNDTCTVRPHQVFEDWFDDESCVYTSACMQDEVVNHETYKKHYKTLQKNNA